MAINVGCSGRQAYSDDAMYGFLRRGIGYCIIKFSVSAIVTSGYGHKKKAQGRAYLRQANLALTGLLHASLIFRLVLPNPMAFHHPEFARNGSGF